MAVGGPSLSNGESARMLPVRVRRRPEGPTGSGGGRGGGHRLAGVDRCGTDRRAPHRRRPRCGCSAGVGVGTPAVGAVATSAGRDELRRVPGPGIERRIERAVGAEQGDEDEGGDDHRSHADERPGQAAPAARRPPGSRTAAVRPRPGGRRGAGPGPRGLGGCRCSRAGGAPTAGVPNGVVGASATAGTASTTVGASASPRTALAGPARRPPAARRRWPSGPDVVGATTSAAAVGAESASTAPRATRSASPRTVGTQPSCSVTVRATSGIRAEPPTSSSAVNCPGSTPADAIVRRRASTVRSTCGAISPLERRPIKPDGAAELAAPDPHDDLVLGAQRLLREGARAPDPRDRRHVVGQRRPGRAATPARRGRDRRGRRSPRARPSTAKPPRASRPAQHGGVEPAAPEVVDRDRVTRLGAASAAWATARGSATNVTPRSCAARAEASRSSVSGAHDAGCARAIPAGCSPSFSTTRSTTQRTSRADSSSAAHGWPPSSTGAGSPTRRLRPRTTRVGSIPARLAAASPTVTPPVPGEVQHRRHGAAARTQRHDLRVARPLGAADDRRRGALPKSMPSS